MKHELTLNGYKVWQNEFDGKINYSISFGSKRKDGGFDNAYMTVKFPKGFDYPNGTEINGKGFLGFSLNKETRKPYWYIVIMEYELVTGSNQPMSLDLSGTAFKHVADGLPF